MTRTRRWAAFPYDQDDYDYSGAALKKHWKRLHRGDCEPFPSVARVSALCEPDPSLTDSIDGFDGSHKAVAERLQTAWCAYHRGDFQEAVKIGSGLGVIGAAVANKSAGIYATYLDEDDHEALEIFQAAVERGEKARKVLRDEANSHYFHAFNLGRYSQGISVAKALAKGLGGTIKKSLDRAIALQPRHAEAHTALGLYHAEIIDKVGAIVGNLTYGASKEASLEHFDKALSLHPDSAIARIEYANGLLLLFGDEKMDKARRLYEEAAACQAMDAMERLDVEQAKAELE